jgi:hypothetical protein
MTSRILIGLCGLAGSGKSTVAEHLTRVHGFSRIRFAGALKRMLAAAGVTHDMLDGSAKEEPCALLCNRTPRHAMQTLGTEWGRQCIGQDFWIGLWRAEVERWPSMHIVADDVRFPNELAAVRALGGRIWLVKRPALRAMPHASEQLDFGTCPPNLTLHNYGSIDDLHTKVDDIAGAMLAQAR